MKYLKEGVYADICQSNAGIFTKYQEWCKQMQDKSEERKGMIESITEANRKLIEIIDECLIDLEDNLLRRIDSMSGTEYDPFDDLPFSNSDVILKVQYKFSTNEIDKITDMLDKLNSYIGSESYNAGWTAGVMATTPRAIKEMPKCEDPNLKLLLIFYTIKNI